MGHNVKILTYGYEDEENFSIDFGVMCKKYQFQGIPIISIKHINSPNFLNFNIFEEELNEFFYNFLEEQKFDAIHVAHPLRLGNIIRVANSLNIPIILTLTDFWLICPRAIAVTQKGSLCDSSNNGKKCAKECFGNFREEDCTKRFDQAKEIFGIVKRITAPSNFLAGKVKKELDKNIQVVRHGIEYKDLQPNNKLKKKDETIVFGYIGTVIPHKGVHIIAKALSLIQNKNIKIKIYGHYFSEIDYFNNLKNMVKNDERIEFLGEYKDEEMQSMMNDIDCILAPSIWWENSPLTILTSLAYKVPVITINIGGAAEFVKDGVNGFNFEIENPESLAKVMEKIANSPEILNELKSHIIRPPRIEEESFEYEKLYRIYAQTSN